MSLARYLTNIASTPAILYNVYRHLKVQQAFMQKELLPYLKKIEQHHDGTIHKGDISKIKKYYGLAVPSVFGEAFAALRGKPLSEHERRAFTYLGSTTGLFDDFFDDNQLQDDYIQKLYQQPATYTGQNDNEKLFNHCWQNALNGCANKNLLIYFANKVFVAQVKSRLQQSTIPDEDTVRQITYEKGGYSVLFYMSLFYEIFPAEDESLFYNIGALLQLENDLFDVYKDHNEGICTLVTHTRGIGTLAHEFTGLWKKVQQSIANTRYTINGKKAFEKDIAILVSRGFVCLGMLQQREKENGGSFLPAAFSRKQLICDLEKPVNLLRTLHHYARIA